MRNQTTIKNSNSFDGEESSKSLKLSNLQPFGGVDDNPATEVSTRTLVIEPDVRSSRRRGDSHSTPESDTLHLRSIDAKLEEASGLARAIDLEIIDARIISVNNVRPATLFGKGKVEELKGAIAADDIYLVVIDHNLSPIQQRNLERAWHCKVLDRTGLILEIFSARAQTREGRLQVNLAHLDYQKSRLVRSWTHLERQRGGLGTVGGPGETQIESDHRQIQDRINKIKKQLETVTRTRGLHRSSRKKVPYPIVALVGYTNAGKSSLFNRLSGADVMAKDMLFATLDPTMREIKLTNGRRIIVSDTVGFISELPTHLIAAFRATLEEVLDADLIIHVRDISSDETQAQALDVEQVLGTLGVGEENADRNLIEVWNKMDLLEDTEKAIIHEQAMRNDQAVCVSAHKGEGLDLLVDLIDRQITLNHSHQDVELKYPDGRTVHWIYQNCDVMARQDNEDGSVHFSLRVPPEKRSVLKQMLMQT